MSTTQVVSLDELIGRAEALLPAIADRALQTERARRIPQETLDEIEGAGLNRSLHPVRYGGYGLDYDAFFEISWRLSSACGSTGWVYSVASVHHWQLGLAPIVVVTGGSQPGDRFTEAEASAAYLVERGVPSDVIVQEQDGRSSWESLANVADLLEGTGVERILLVSDPFHSLRIRLTAEELGFEAYTSPTRSSPVTGASALSREAKEAAGIAAGRIIGFERLWRLTG